MLESIVERRVCEYAKSKGWLVFKFTSPGHIGVPDRMFIRDGKVFFIEFKQKGKKPTLLQQRCMDKIAAEGITALVADSVEAGKVIVDAQ